MNRCTVWGRFVAAAALVLLGGCHATGQPNDERQSSNLVHYVEIVCSDVAALCASLARVHGLSFGPPVAELGNARVATAPGGSLIGVRASMAAHEKPIVRTYLTVADIAKAIKAAEATGGVVAYPPTRQGDTGTWAIYSLGDVQFGLWQR
jgi:predicted enzyme related to lactoylglutathione lyase